MMLFSALALHGGVMVGTVPSAVFRSKAGGGWEELEGVRKNSANANFPPSPELQSRARYLARDPLIPARLYAGIEVGGMLTQRRWRAQLAAGQQRPLRTWTFTKFTPARNPRNSLCGLRRQNFSQLRPRRSLGRDHTQEPRLRHVRRRRR